VLAFSIAIAGGRIGGDAARLGSRGRWVAGATLLVAAVYELTPLRTSAWQVPQPLGFCSLLARWLGGRAADTSRTAPGASVAAGR
jgi:hypothetical protein